MKPAWHEVVASLETSLARGSNGAHSPNVGNGRLPIVIPRSMPLAWREAVADRPAAPTAPAIAPVDLTMSRGDG